MKYLLLARHAKAAQGPPEMNDIDRPLNAQGKNDAERMGLELARQSIMPERVISSSAERAMTTARLFMDAAGIDRKCLQQDPSLYDTTAHGLLDCVYTLPDTLSSVALVGHNPVMTDFMHALCGEHTQGMSAGAMVYLSFDVNRWVDIRYGEAIRNWDQSPKLLTE